jgi:hypothetical protein
MKTCHEGDRAAVALLAADALPAPEAERVRRHLASCASCRGYFREIEAVAGEQRRATHGWPGMGLSAPVRRRIATAIRSESPERRAFRPAEFAVRWRRWAGALTATAALVVVGFAVVRTLDRGPETGRVVVATSPNPAPTVVPDGFRQGETTEPSPVLDLDLDLNALRTALNRSEAEFERLLATGRSGSPERAEVKFRPGGAGVDVGW